jgi:rubrerythrin
LNVGKWLVPQSLGTTKETLIHILNSRNMKAKDIQSDGFKVDFKIGLFDKLPLEIYFLPILKQATLVDIYAPNLSEEQQAEEILFGHAATDILSKVNTRLKTIRATLKAISIPKEKEINEITRLLKQSSKLRCMYCGAIFSWDLDRCPYCNASASEAALLF